MQTVFDVPNPTVAPIVGTEKTFPVRRIFCVGRNYAAHAKEMGKDPDRDPPFFFTKWPQSYVPNDSTIPYPRATANYHFEIELVVAIGKQGKDISQADAPGHIFGYAVGLDMTRRDLQLEARDKGRPWDTGKNFEQSMPLSEIHPVETTGLLENGVITLEVDGDTRQEADLADLIWNVNEIIEHLSRLYELEPGDLIMTGTPAGVGPVVSGNSLVGHIGGLTSLRLKIE